ncbi:caspase family protein [Vibrio metschnikovii]|nr:caspase family protein [Vibrio metschnikovii]EKO3612117.1 caspase family protein [Vibrio metschnikovii]EKO3684886.1 caspase family protein [Vibrio metschnikovii]EKO3715601.1 caspase family protein [Vibrio metschnikovii]EKO3722564.1 caspase family protein [Vibrio metschnikovii]
MKVFSLVIGNNEYPGRHALDNAVNDASAIADVFARLGYEVLHKENCSSADYGLLLQDFSDGMAQADASIFYFAGHGFEFQGENYLTSIDTPLDSPTEYMLNRTCIRMKEITDLIKRASTKVNIVIIDACRSSFDRGVANSIASVVAPQGTIIAFSTSPGEGAKDAGFEGHSLYTGALLQYIGRESLSVEELFKKTRKTVHNLSEGAQTSWEHTSLVGDFFFNTGQLVHSMTLPYGETAVKDRLFEADTSDIELVIENLKSCNWNYQNPAMVKLRGIATSSMSPDQKFLLGRNILQSSEYAYESQNFMANLRANLKPYHSDGCNDVLNGMLFEIYFDNNGDFRQGKFKTYHLEEILSLRQIPEFQPSFNFIQEALSEYRDQLCYIPSSDNTSIDVDILARSEVSQGSDKSFELIESIVVGDKDITGEIEKMAGFRTSFEHLKSTIATYLTAPENLLNINCGVQINNFRFVEKELDLDF